jgi:hypothetical protein
MEDVLKSNYGNGAFQTKHLIIENLMLLLFVQKRKLYNFYRKFYKTC